MTTATTERRRRLALLPWWIELPCWIFVLFLAIPLFALAGLDGVTVSVPGFEYTGHAWDPEALLLQFILFLHGVAAYGLLRARSWGPSVAMGVLALGVILYVAAGIAHRAVEPGGIVYAVAWATLWRLRPAWLASER